VVNNNTKIGEIVVELDHFRETGSARMKEQGEGRPGGQAPKARKLET
jgi:hypothetical protein